MGYLGHLLLAILVQSLAEVGLRTGVVAPLWMLALLAAPHLLGAGIRRLLARGSARWADAGLALLHWLPVALFALAVGALGWLETVEAWLGASPSLMEWPHPAALVALAPLLAWCLLAIDARARVIELTPAGRSAHRRFYARMLLSIFAPLALYVLVAWPVGESELLRVSIEEIGLFGAAFYVGLLLLFVIGLPGMLRLSWDTGPLPPGPLRDVLGLVAARAGFRCRQLLLWRTGGLMANAAVVGVFPWQRLVLFSDALLAQLDLREAAAVFGHEIGHVARRHVPIFGAWVLGFLMIADLLATHVVGKDELTTAATLLPLSLLWFLSFGFLSRRFELEADLYGAELTGDTPALVSALERVGGGPTRRRSSWRHFSTADRIAFLCRARERPEVARALRRRLKRLSRLGIVVFAAAGALELASLSMGWEEGHLTADLRLGRYVAAEERLATMEEPEEGLVRLARRAAELERGLGEAPSAAALEGAARAALLAGDGAATLEWLELAWLRGADHLLAPARALELAHEEKWEEARAALSGAGPTWAALLAPRLAEGRDRPGDEGD